MANKKRQAKKAAKYAKKHPKVIIALFLVLFVIVAAIVVLWFVKPALFHKLLGTGEHEWSEWQITLEADCGNAGSRERECSLCGEKQTEPVPATGLHNFNEDGECTVCGQGDFVGSESEIPSADLSVHFLELGNANTGDCTLIKCGDTEVLIDAGSKRDSTATVKQYIDEYCTDGVLEYVIATHAHEDHIAALVGEKNKDNGVLYSYEIGTVIQFAGHKTTSVVYNDYVLAVDYVKSRGTEVYTAKQCWYGTDGAQKQYYLDEAQTVSLNILYQKYYDETTSNENNYSVCTLLTQVTGDTEYNYLFTGDLEKSGEESLVSNNELPECVLFKGGHHGSSTSSNDALLEVIRPEHIAICACAGTYEYAEKPESGKNPKPEEVTKLNTFPTQEALDRMAKWTDKIYVTSLGILNDDYSTKECVSMNGNIVFYFNKRLKLYCSNNTVILKETDWFKANRTWNG